MLRRYFFFFFYPIYTCPPFFPSFSLILYVSLGTLRGATAISFRYPLFLFNLLFCPSTLPPSRPRLLYHHHQLHLSHTRRNLNDQRLSLFFFFSIPFSHWQPYHFAKHAMVIAQFRQTSGLGTLIQNTIFPVFWWFLSCF